jgi:hypothetical protein
VSSHGDGYEEDYFLGCDALTFGRCLPMFRRNALPPSPMLQNKLNKKTTKQQIELSAGYGNNSSLRILINPQPDYTASHPRRQCFSVSMSWMFNKIISASMHCGLCSVINFETILFVELYLMGYNTTQSVESQPTFRGNISS